MNAGRPYLLPALAAAAVAAVTACTPAGEPPGTDVDVAAETVTWADTVCGGVHGLRQSLDGVGEGLTVNPLDGAAGVDEARRLVEEQVGAVERAIDDVRAGVAAAPDEPAAQEARQALESALAEVDTSQQTALDQAVTAFDADSVPAAVAAAGTALNAVRRAVEGAGDLVANATGTASGASAQVREAFARAPACQDLNGKRRDR